MSSSIPDVKEMALAIAENSAQGIVVMDEAGHCLFANRAWTEVTGFTAEDMKGKPVHDWVHHQYPDGRIFPIDECPIGCTLGNSESVRNHRDLFFRKNGAPFHVSCAASPIIIDGIPVLKVLEIRDVSDEVELEKRKDDFLAMLAHELRNPLAPISAAAELLQAGRLDETGIRQSSKVIARQVNHMAGLINDLLDVSRVTRGLVELEMEGQDLKSVIAEAIEQVRPLIETRRHWLALNTAPEEAWVRGDRKRLVQVFANILVNAAKYTTDGGEITVSIEPGPRDLQVAIADNGIGMTAEMCEHAFDLFSQAQRLPDRTQGGLGIGLALVRSLVTLHDGIVTAHSEGLGKGSTVTVSLPRMSTGRAIVPKDLGDDPISVTTTPLRILIVEDGRDTAETLAILLKSLGHAVHVEYDPHTALDAAHGGAYDVFLLDLGLPGMDGLELARRIRLQPQHAQSLLIAVTGYGQPQDRQSAIDAGFNHHLIKPLDLLQLNTILAFHGRAS
ncbi:ATP-binding protein [Noviherbaspirillum sp.]|uniref:hybrid sensor histidine kinase/response regulator n=1 Tax=Noviherbaspirillum sp. TaxID=1926288 RepID=UPI002D75DAE2|nr:ATP-binding protein [Noviherbaspirillum sp.]HZW20178.1 ATP-binding protein [Noviherbaspirillum sp.]